MKNAHQPNIRQRGFTLVEAIIVMVVTGVLAGVMVLFIRQPIQNYVDASARADLSDTADLALRRMARELRSALPNSIRTLYSGGVWYVQFIPVKAGGQYLAVEDNASSGIPLSFTSTSSTKFDVVGPMPTGTATITPGTDYIVVYNLGNGITDADAYTQGNMQQVAAVSGTTITLANNFNQFAVPAANGRTPNTSPDHRFNVMNLPVTFRCEGKADGTGTLTRIPNNALTATQTAVAWSANTPRLATNVQECDFSATQSGSLHSALIGMTLSLARPRAGVSANGLETVTLVHQIHVDNTP